jgi:outer membrane protein
MNKKFLSIAAFIAFFAVSSFAQRIAYVDVTAILESVPEYNTAQRQLDALATQWRQEISLEQDKVKGLYSKFQADAVLLSDEMKRQREEEIMAKEKEVREMQRRKFGQEGELFRKREELVKPIQEKVYSAIEKYAQNKGFDFIFDKGSASGMLFADPRYDKTEDLKALMK